MAHTPTMMDYVAMANARMFGNLDRAEALTEPLVSAYLAHLSDAGDPVIRLVASGSSKNACDMARPYVQRTLDTLVQVMTPEAFCAGDHAYPADAFNLFISQSGYSTNVIRALDVCTARGFSCTALTGNVTAPIARHAVSVLDWGVGVESVDFVTMGVATLVEYLLLFAVHAAWSLGSIDEAAAEKAHGDIRAAIEAHGQMLDTARAYVGEHRLDLTRVAPCLFVGNGPAYGVAEEAALKFAETLKQATAFYEGEEFMHGPEMQVRPGYHVFVMDPEGSDRLATTARIMGGVTESAVLVTSKPTGTSYEVPLASLSDPLTAGIPLLAFFQTIAATLSQELDCWEVHPYLKGHEGEFDSKAPGYEDAVLGLEAQAATLYGTC